MLVFCQTLNTIIDVRFFGQTLNAMVINLLNKNKGVARGSPGVPVTPSPCKPFFK